MAATIAVNNNSDQGILDSRTLRQAIGSANNNNNNNRGTSNCVPGTNGIDTITFASS